MILLAAIIAVACLFLGAIFVESIIQKRKWKRFWDHKHTAAVKHKVG